MSQFQLPDHRDLFYGGAWHQATGGTAANVSPSNGRELGSFAVAGAEDVDRAVAAARAGFAQWRRVAPLGVVVRIIPFNHPFMFCAGKPASALAAGNAVIVKPPEQAPLSALRIAELAGDLFPPGVLSVVTGDGATGAALASHPGVAKAALIGSVNAGRAVMRAGADHIRPVLLELGGKNALIAFADADPGAVARAAVAGMNFGWCGQSCGSTSRAFLHDAIHDEVLDRVADELKQIRPGPPEDPATSMGALVSRAHRDRVLGYIARGQAEGARLVAGGGPPADPSLAGGCFIEPTVFADVAQDMTIAREEIFGPVLSVLRWGDPRA